MEKKEATTAIAEARYRRTLAGYEARLRTEPRRSFSSYCREVGTCYRYITEWMNETGITVPVLAAVAEADRVAAGEDVRFDEDMFTVGKDAFMQFVPACLPESEKLHDVKLTFADGTGLEVGKCSIDSLVGLLEEYGRRKSGRA